MADKGWRWIVDKLRAMSKDKFTLQTIRLSLAGALLGHAITELVYEDAHLGEIGALIGGLAVLVARMK